MRADFLFLSALSFVALSQAFYIPGWSIKSYEEGEVIPLSVNKVYSDHTQLQYAYSELPFVCEPQKQSHGSEVSGTTRSLNLGEILRGDRVVVSDYELRMGKDDEAHFLCNKEVDANGLDKALEIVKDGYIAEWIVDNLPGATRFVTEDKSKKHYAAGFKMGYIEIKDKKPTYFVNNHVTIVIRYNKAPGRDGEHGKKVIVAFEVFPKSFEAGNRDKNGLPHKNSVKGMELPAELKKDTKLTIPYTYSIHFREDTSIEWGNRWDLYLADEEDTTKIHWLAIINSVVFLGLLSTVIAVIVARTVHGDIKAGLEDSKRTRSSKGNGLLDQPGDVEALGEEETLEDITGWKLVHGDVFRPPPYSGLLAPLVGSGMQLLFMATGLIILSCFGVLNPSFRGGHTSVGIGLFIFAGLFSGYFSARIYKTFGGKKWRKNVLVTGVALPGLLFAIVFIVNLFVWAQASSTAIPFTTLLALLCLWLLIQLPLVYVGSWHGYERVGAWEHPIKVNAIPRQIPRQAWYARSVRTILLAGLVPFAVIFIELLFVFKSLWQDKTGYYYVFGFLAVVCVILLIVVIEISIIATYVQLNSENYHWWWQSFLVGASSSIWIFVYSVWFYFTRLHISGFVSGLLFFVYSFLACTLYGLLTGTVGFLAAYMFVRRIYAAIKTD